MLDKISYQEVIILILIKNYSNTIKFILKDSYLIFFQQSAVFYINMKLEPSRIQKKK